MRRMRLFILTCLFAAAAALLTSRPTAAPPDLVSVEVIRYESLGDRIQALKGRAVVVDFWATYCLPCKKEFPRLVELHRKYATKGLAAVSVSLDDATDEHAREEANRFLTDKQAAFSNFLLDEKPEFWQAKLKIDGPPCVFVFDRSGRLVKRYHDDVDYSEIDRIVADLLK
jgi:thiol-disulfide isomerase/thioredoxin